MTAAAQAELTDNQRALHAMEKARRVLPPGIAAVVSERLREVWDMPRLVNRGRWRALVDEVMALDEPTQVAGPVISPLS